MESSKIGQTVGNGFPRNFNDPNLHHDFVLLLFFESKIDEYQGLRRKYCHKFQFFKKKILFYLPSSAYVSIVMDTKSNEEDKSKCAKFLEASLDWNFVKFVKDKMEELGCSTNNNEVFAFKCVKCNNRNVIGSFHRREDGKKELFICEDNVEDFGLGKKSVRRAVLHELIHAYDTCRVKLDQDNCDHLACTEIRAALLSGDCDMKIEWVRRNYGWRAQGTNCVKRRAELSIAGHSACAGSKAKESVERVFEACYSDTAPFETKF